MNWNLNGPGLVFSADGADNNNANSNNITFTIKGKKLYVPVLNVSTKDNQKLSKLISIGFERSVYWNRWKTKSENKNTTNEYRKFEMFPKIKPFWSY